MFILIVSLQFNDLVLIWEQFWQLFTEVKFSVQGVLEKSDENS